MVFLETWLKMLRNVIGGQKPTYKVSQMYPREHNEKHTETSDGNTNKSTLNAKQTL